MPTPGEPRLRRFEVGRPQQSPASALDAVAVEEPLEIRLEGVAIAVVMRTPGDDDDLVRGFLLTEGIVLRPDEVRAVELDDEGHADARLRDGVTVDAAQFQRNLFVSSSCGICGKASIEAVDLLAPPARPFTVTHGVVSALTARLREQQPTFDATGGLHAAGIFDLAGEPLVVREDVGRHNAVDKCVGALGSGGAPGAGGALPSLATPGAGGWPPPPALLVVSGRQSFEIVQKAAMARLGGVVGVSAPSSLAIELAAALGLLLVGFARDGRYNVYAGAEHLDG